jgi:hypothetical protein
VIVLALKDDDMTFICSAHWLKVCELAGLSPCDAFRIRLAYLRDQIDIKKLEVLNQATGWFSNSRSH